MCRPEAHLCNAAGVRPSRAQQGPVAQRAMEYVGGNAGSNVAAPGDGRTPALWSRAYQLVGGTPSLAKATAGKRALPGP